MKRTTIIRLAIIVPLLALIGWGSWYGVNMLVARQLSLLELVEIGDLDGVKYVCRWDRGQVSESGIHDCRGTMVRLPHYVDSSDTLKNIATMYGTEEQWIVAANPQLRRGVELSQLREIQVPIGHFSRQCMPLSCAAGRGNIAVVRALLESGADANVIVGNESPLTRCVSSPSPRRVEVCRLLLAHGADSSRRLGGMPLIHWVAGSGDPILVSLLLDHGLDVNRKWMPGRIRELSEEVHTPLDLADDPRVRSILRTRGAKSWEELRRQNVEYRTEK